MRTAPGPLPARQDRVVSPRLASAVAPRRARGSLARSLIGLGACLVTAALGAEMEPPPSRPRAEVLGRPCLACHITGPSADAGTPSLDLTEARFVDAMRAFRNGTRKGSVMNRIARGYAEEDIAQLAQVFSRLGIRHR